MQEPPVRRWASQVSSPQSTQTYIQSVLGTDSLVCLHLPKCCLFRQGCDTEQFYIFYLPFSRSRSWGGSGIGEEVQWEIERWRWRNKRQLLVLMNSPSILGNHSQNYSQLEVHLSKPCPLLLGKASRGCFWKLPGPKVPIKYRSLSESPHQALLPSKSSTAMFFKLLGMTQKIKSTKWVWMGIFFMNQNNITHIRLGHS